MVIDNTYRTIKNEDYEKLLGLANLNKKAIDEYVKETFNEVIDDYKDTIKEQRSKLEYCKRINDKLLRMNNKIIETVLKELTYSDTSRAIFRNLEEYNRELRREL